MNVFEIIDRYYPEPSNLRRVLLVHSWQVAEKSLEVARKHPELHLDEMLLFDGAMLHDIGIFLTHAPGIFCEGTADYLLHGYYGGRLLRREGLDALARICERHTGTGLSTADFEKRGLEVPDVGLTPETLEEKVVCYADKFYSKSSLYRLRTAEDVVRSLAKFGDEVTSRFLEWHSLFG